MLWDVLAPILILIIIGQCIVFPYNKLIDARRHAQKKYTKNDEAWLTTTNDDAGFIQQLIWKEEYIIVSSVYGIFFASTFSVEFHELVVYIK